MTDLAYFEPWELVPDWKGRTVYHRRHFRYAGAQLPSRWSHHGWFSVARRSDAPGWQWKIHERQPGGSGNSLRTGTATSWRAARAAAEEEFRIIAAQQRQHARSRYGTTS